MIQQQITIDELVELYQKEMGILIHNKILSSLQIKKLEQELNKLDAENSNLRSELEKLKENSVTARKSRSV